MTTTPVHSDQVPPSARLSARRRALLALVLLVPAPSIGVIVAMLVPATEGTALGKGLFMAAKAWLVLFPAAWWILVERGRPSLSPARKGGFGIGIALGLVISAVIGAGFFLFGSWIDPATVQASARDSGIGTLPMYLGFCALTATVNAVLEEYVWRWFVVRQCDVALGGRHFAAVFLSAALFTIHHVFALAAQLDWRVTVVASAGVFVGGAIWSWCYMKFGSIWPGYVSHVIVDVTIFVIGYMLIF